ncbi:MAG: sulfotransferase [Solirubrobacterales bacterium]|nr:sulfotransferase [Solirubrobacterales bacterium]
MSPGPFTRARDGLSPADTARPPAPFVVGLTRSGTTLLRMMLDAHRELTIPPETHFVPDVIKAARGDGDVEQVLAAFTANRTWGDFGIDAEEMRTRLAAVELGDEAGALRAFFEAYAEGQGKPRWGDKTPAYMLSVQRIGRVLPEARFIHLIRDGRDVALSQSARSINEQPPPAEQAGRWVKRIRKAREQASALKGPRYVEARYEDLVRDSETTLRRICEFIELPWDAGVLSYHERAAERLGEMAGELRAEGTHAQQQAGYRIDNHAPTTKPPDPSKLDKWKREMEPEDVAAYEAVAGELLGDLGYEVSSS